VISAACPCESVPLLSPEQFFLNKKQVTTRLLRRVIGTLTWRWIVSINYDQHAWIQAGKAMIRTLQVISLSLAALILAACSVSRTTAIDEPATHEGLQRIQVGNIDAVYQRPGVNYSQYRRLLIRDVDIAFSRGWEQTQKSATSSWSHEDSERIKRELADLFARTVRRELETEGGYEVVSAPGQDVLEIRPSIIDLYINAPDLSRSEPGIVRRYTMEAGRMTLVAELRDSISGELLARAYDKRDDMRGTQWEWTTSVTNSQKAQQAISLWADALRDALDRARTTP
jgi:hypothetical protein